MSTQATAEKTSPSQYLNPAQVLTCELRDDGSIPNSRLPLIVYQKAIDLRGHDPASHIERIFEAHGWSGSWRNGIYPYHHFHSTAHEVLGVYKGSATVQFGGDRGTTQQLEAGDVVLIPAGVAHKRLSATADFAVVGAYPGGQEADMCYGRAGERPDADRRIVKTPLPTQDPVYGPNGPVRELWRSR